MANYVRRRKHNTGETSGVLFLSIIYRPVLIEYSDQINSFNKYNKTYLKYVSHWIISYKTGVVTTTEYIILNLRPHPQQQ